MKKTVSDRVVILLQRMIYFLAITEQDKFSRKDIRNLRVHIKRWKAYTMLIKNEWLRANNRNTVLYELDKKASQVRECEVMIELLSHYKSEDVHYMIQKLQKKQKSRNKDLIKYTQQIKRKKFIRQITWCIAEYTLPTSAKLKQLLQGYVTVNYNAMKDLLVSEDIEDEVLHTIRRWVKEITYNTIFVEWSEHDIALALKNSGKVLGDRHDKTEFLLFLKKQHTHKPSKKNYIR